MDNSRIPCRNCLIREMKDESLRASIERTINAVPEDQKTDPSLYEKRLEACRCCSNLLSGVCRVCGCFVEVRAAVKTNSCPQPGVSRW